MSELYYAEMEAARNEAEDAFFKARPSLGTEVDHALFRAGYERAFQKLWNSRCCSWPECKCPGSPGTCTAVTAEGVS